VRYPVTRPARPSSTACLARSRMINLDDRTLFFANLEDAADYLGFDLAPPWPNRASRRGVPIARMGTL
jgi:hypothetical protein